MFTTRLVDDPGIDLYRAVVVRSNKTTGELLVKIPEVLGATEALPISKDFLIHRNGVWRVPPEGAQVLVGLDGPRARITYVVADLSTIETVESCYGSFYSTNEQTAASANTATSMKFNVTDISSGVSVVNNSQITFASAGVYDIQFSTQLYHKGSSGKNIYIWFSKNGNSISNSATRLNITNGDYLVAAWDFMVNVNSGDFIEIMWQTENVDIVIEYVTASGAVPAIPSIIATVMQVNTVSTPDAYLGFVN